MCVDNHVCCLPLDKGVLEDPQEMSERATTICAVDEEVSKVQSLCARGVFIIKYLKKVDLAEGLSLTALFTERHLPKS